MAGVARFAGAPVPAWFAIVAVAVAVLGGVGVGKLYAENRAAEALAASMAEGRLEKLDGDTVAFTVASKEFADAVMAAEGQPFETSRERLTSQIAAMHARVRGNEGWYNRSTGAAAGLYQEKMLVFRKAVLKVDGVLTMKPYWETISALIVAQKIFLEEMNRQLSGKPGCGEVAGRGA